ncbi:GNAT family N-acetyltransferase [Kribbella solani]|uniref:GNAT family N-acetyltransferase n=1 Tax=Kribbella solani TaxID=236067 RepID=UPI0029B14C44|nr:GNAT family N-acetyltransferase [Kribbella solani]MDX2971547.1 GNAT family N-acetyltransferase [Kribbella solani]MDX3002825.1 GNAT family N-acetyltransferase [Kribbella solani]
MPILVVPTVAVHRSFLAAWDELAPEEVHWLGPKSIAGDDELWSRERAADPAEFHQLVEAIKGEAEPATVLPPGIVHQTVLWFVDGVEFLGRLSIRHYLTPPLLELAGHIGYFVRPSARRQGHATRMLAQSLPIAAALGIEPALVTCDVDNVGSHKVIEAAGGELEDERHGKLRFWVPTEVA